MAECSSSLILVRYPQYWQAHPLTLLVALPPWVLVHVLPDLIVLLVPAGDCC